MGSPQHYDLVLGVDGGGTTTIAVLAVAATGAPLGRGVAGPSNMQAVGNENALQSLDRAIDAAFQSAGLTRAAVGAACLGLAGVDRENGVDVIHAWANRVELGRKVEVANDATLLLAAGTPDGWGLAVIAGTGSIAFVKGEDGCSGRAGGWGYVLGDEGSAYAIARSGLRAVCRAFDGASAATILTDRILAKTGVADVPGLIPAVYQGPWDRAAIAGLAPLVMEAAVEGDSICVGIVREEAGELARTAAAAVRTNGLSTAGVPIALAGGVLTKSEAYREEFLGALLAIGIAAGPVSLVTDPVDGAIVLARKMI